MEAWIGSYGCDEAHRVVREWKAKQAKQAEYDADQRPNVHHEGKVKKRPVKDPARAELQRKQLEEILAEDRKKDHEVHVPYDIWNKKRMRDAFEEAEKFESLFNTDEKWSDWSPLKNEYQPIEWGPEKMERQVTEVIDMTEEELAI